MKRHFVTFYSPGTFVAETTTQEIEAWDTLEALQRAARIVERYEARPYGFRFTTRERGDAELDSRETAVSPMYYLGGRVETIDEIRARGDDCDRILLSNMEANGWDRVVTTYTPYRCTQPLREGDVVLPFNHDTNERQ